ncbi:hypothetical protein [Amycolatopsis coloradensis]|uniref:hypothetical protein n=1 Tax=Amycolatopsis coloradensis TaxID=76021 RepID=UPI001FC949B1|nr:hypothetical protein [Amycolatopsis coloradensis]
MEPEVRLVVATDGEAAYPGSSAAEHRELLEALRCQGLEDVESVWVGLPDSALAGHEAELTDVIGEVAADSDSAWRLGRTIPIRTQAKVLTSARLDGRAPDGLSTLLRALTRAS